MTYDKFWKRFIFWRQARRQMSTYGELLRGSLNKKYDEFSELFYFKKTPFGPWQLPFFGFPSGGFSPPKKKSLNSTKFVTIFGNICQIFVITKCKKKHLQLNCKREYKKVWCLTKQGVCHTVALPFTLKRILGQKKNYGNSNISPCQNIIFKKSSKRNQNPSR